RSDTARHGELLICPQTQDTLRAHAYTSRQLHFMGLPRAGCSGLPEMGNLHPACPHVMQTVYQFGKSCPEPVSPTLDGSWSAACKSRHLWPPKRTHAPRYEPWAKCRCVSSEKPERGCPSWGLAARTLARRICVRPKPFVSFAPRSTAA